jgi:hypothetical protein
LSIKKSDPHCYRHGSKRIKGAECSCLKVCNLCGGEFTGSEHDTWACIAVVKARMGPLKQKPGRKRVFTGRAYRAKDPVPR